MSAILPNVNVLAQLIKVLEPENKKVGWGVLTFLRRSRSHINLLYTTIPSCMSVQDNVVVAAIVSEILPFENFL